MWNSRRLVLDRRLIAESDQKVKNSLSREKCSQTLQAWGERMLRRVAEAASGGACGRAVGSAGRCCGGEVAEAQMAPGFAAFPDFRGRLRVVPGLGGPA